MKENFDEILPHLDERRGLMSFTRHLCLPFLDGKRQKNIGDRRLLLFTIMFNKSKKYGKNYINPPSISIVGCMTEDERKKDRELIAQILERRYDVLVVLS
ncbi:MAG: hypothetical protein JSV56_04490 [Methanomassiliicoccales archaeon]|nr:MAG: hypothetical protein JSV56_04490 [Methanomassiliicoccales archaeon]